MKQKGSHNRPKYKADRKSLICIRCKRRKLKQYFTPNKKCRDGVDHQCKACRTAQRRLGKPRDEGKQFPPLRPGPKHCGLSMGMRDEWCWQEVVYGTDGFGMATIWCPRHGERYVKRTTEQPPKERHQQGGRVPHGKHARADRGEPVVPMSLPDLDSGLAPDEVDY